MSFYIHQHNNYVVTNYGLQMGNLPIGKNDKMTKWPKIRVGILISQKSKPNKLEYEREG